MSQSKNHSGSHNYGPGNVLRNKRKEYEWSVEAVADALHLPVTHISAIEDDRFEDLPGSTYVIGYWRSYARLLGIDIEDTIEANKRNVIEEEYEDVVMASQEGMHAHGAKSGVMGLVLTVFLLLVLVAGGLWYAWKQDIISLSSVLGTGEESVQLGSSNPVVDEVKPEPEPVMVAVKPAVKEPVVVLATNTPTNTPQDTQVEPEQIESEQIEPGQNSEAAGGGSLEQQVQAEATEQISAPKVEEKAEKMVEEQVVAVDKKPQEVTSEPEDSEVDQPGSDAQMNEGEITLILEQDSWLDVRDRTLKRLIYRSETRDKTIQLKGEPPFYVYIGTPSGVKVRYMGKEIPFEVHKSGLFARFKVGEKRS